MPGSGWRFRFRRVSGIVLIVVGGVWTLAWGLLWSVMWELAGAEGVGLMALDWRFLGPTALGLAVVAIGIGMASVQRRPAAAERPARRVSMRWLAIVSLVALLGGVVAVEWRMSVVDEGPYPFEGVPTGSLIAYSDLDGIRLVRVTGGRSWLVSGSGGMSDPHWAPGGDRLAAVDLGDSGAQAYSFAVDGSERTPLPSTDELTAPVWSPDGRRLAVVDAGISIVRLSDGAVEATLPIAGNQPAWAPDGKLLAFQADGDDDLLQIYLVRPDGSGLRALTSGGGGSGNRTGADSAAWSPDGRNLAFDSDRDGEDEIYIVRRDGTGLRKVTDNAVEDCAPTWSPDGRRIAFDRTDYERDRTSIVVLDLATGAETEIAHSDGGFVSEPAWQPAAGRGGGG